MPPESADKLEAAVSRMQLRLDQTIRQIAGPEGLATVVHVRELAQAAHSGRPAALTELTRTLEQLTEVERRVVARALSIFLDLMNVADRAQRRQSSAVSPIMPSSGLCAHIATRRTNGSAEPDIPLLSPFLTIQCVAPGSRGELEYGFAGL